MTSEPKIRKLSSYEKKVMEKLEVEFDAIGYGKQSFSQARDEVIPYVMDEMYKSFMNGLRAGRAQSGKSSKSGKADEA